MNLIKVLKNIGLNDKEAKVYLALLEYGEALPSALAKKAMVKRPTAYVILDQLKAKGLAGSVKKNNSLYFKALTPYALLDEQYSRYVELEKALPELLGLNAKVGATPQMTVFEGEEGLIRIMEDTLTTKTDLLCWADVSLAVGTVLKDYYPKYVHKKVEKKVFLRGVLCYDKTALRFKKEAERELRDVRLVPKEKFPFKNEINIYDDKVAIISHQDSLGVIIQNKAIADTQRAIFELGFEYAEILEKKVLTKEDLKYLKG